MKKPPRHEPLSLYPASLDPGLRRQLEHLMAGFFGVNQRCRQFL